MTAKKTEKKPVVVFDDVFKREIFDRVGAAVFTTLSVESLDKAVERGDLVSHSEGARVLFLRDDLIDYVRRCPPKPQKHGREVTA
jgi:hypothetical protein